MSISLQNTRHFSWDGLEPVLQRSGTVLRRLGVDLCPFIGAGAAFAVKSKSEPVDFRSESRTDSNPNLCGKNTGICVVRNAPKSLRAASREDLQPQEWLLASFSPQATPGRPRLLVGPEFSDMVV
ncbi:hypothetical protein PSHT_06857 [Puccinia striiformis]|uniref:Uncharacterized protein n=1 Tax=Puccinia striiformis TaxID=27350 RepID=A0A2S4W2J3_9BASI|nr:hypothetical protein PSHT_06857 [Puccinia striiformis]